LGKEKKMSAVAKNNQSFMLFKRNDDDIIKARPYEGEHTLIIKNTTESIAKKYRETISELAKV
jgi:hypothetical protein